MNRIFTIKGGFKVADGTTVYPFLNAKDCMSGLPWDLLEGFSLSAGDIGPHSTSKIHVMPQVTQVTLVMRGELEIAMKDSQAAAPYRLRLAEQQAVITRPATFFQLINPTGTVCRVLYIVSPPYVFDMQDNQILYDDAIIFEEDWPALAALNWRPPALLAGSVTAQARQAALGHLLQQVQKTESGARQPA